MVEGILDSKGDKFLTRRESPTEPPNYYVRTSAGSMTAMTKFPDPQPSIRGIHKELVKYKRNDGVELSFTLYLPPDYKQGTKLPTLIWAYPYEYNDAETAGQVTGSTKRFTELTASTGRLFFVLKGYAVLDNAAMPVVGDPDTVNNTYIEQITADAKAAIDKAASMGVTDPNRVGVGGHSYGSFMTANLLAHTRSVQGGHRGKRRPQSHADAVRLPERAAHHLGGARRLPEDVAVHVRRQDQDADSADPRRGGRQLRHIPDSVGPHVPGDSRQRRHGAAGFPARRSPRLSRKETIEHVLWEELTWFDKYVKDPPPRSATQQ